jgi:hypothetical protein
MPVAAILAGAIDQPLDLALDEIASFTVNILNLMGGVVLEPDQRGGQSRADSQLFEWCWMGVRCDPPAGGTFEF